MNKPVTINDVAQLAGVSKTTISRFLNGRYQNMSEETKARIEKTIAELNYRPSRQAQALKSKRSYLIGVVVADISNLYSSMLLKGIGQVLYQFGFQLMIVDAANSAEQELKLITQLLDQGVEGIILQPTQMASEAYQLLDEAKIPVLLVDRQVTPAKWPLITTDNQDASTALVMLAKELNYQKIAVITEPLANVATREERYQAVQNASSTYDLETELFEVDLTGQEDILAKKLLALKAEPSKTMIFASNGRTLMQVAKLMLELGIEMPKDLGLTGFDDWQVTALIGPGVTSAEQQSEIIGQKAAEQMLGYLNGMAIICEETIVPSLIRIRHSL